MTFTEKRILDKMCRIKGQIKQANKVKKMAENKWVPKYKSSKIIGKINRDQRNVKED